MFRRCDAEDGDEMNGRVAISIKQDIRRASKEISVAMGEKLGQWQ